MKKIFVVEDSKLDKNKIKAVLSELNYELRYFNRAKKVLQVLKNSSQSEFPDLILIDLILAGQISGYQLGVEIKNNYQLPIIFLTGLAKIDQASTNSDLFLTRPIKKKDLKENIQLLLEKKKFNNSNLDKLNKKIVNKLEKQIWYYKDPYTYKLVNASYAQFLGKNEADFFNQNIFNILDLKRAEKIIVENIDIFMEKKLIEKERWIKNSQGESRLLAIKKSPVFDQKGNVQSIFCQADDITEKNILENELRKNRDNLQRIIETIPDMIFLINKNGYILDFWTGDDSKLFYSKDKIIRKNLENILTKAEYKLFQEKSNQLFQNEGTVSFEYSLVIKQVKKFFEAKMINLNSQKNDSRIIVSVRDVSARKNTNLKLRNLSKEYEIILSNVDNAIFLLSVEGEEFRYQRLNCFHEKTTGLKSKEVKGKTPLEVFDKKTALNILKKYKKCVTEKKVISYEEELDLPAGKKIWLTKLTPVIINGKVEKIVGSSLDITENKRKEKEIEYLSFHDKMTGLYNRRYFENELKRLETSRKLPIAILIADLDNLKYINDQFGHLKGDQYIKIAADIIKNSTREADIAARIGGDEFALILPETTLKEADLIYQRIKKQEKNYLETKDAIKTFSISIGYAVKTRPKLKLKEVFKLADQKMYQAKAEKKKNGLNYRANY
ncbi:MAG: diguanylate cyclase [Bacillota bacterium]